MPLVDLREVVAGHGFIFMTEGPSAVMLGWVGNMTFQSSSFSSAGPKSLEQHRAGGLMPTRTPRALVCVLLMMLAAASPVVTPVSAQESILLTVTPQHAVLAPGENLNITLEVNNNASSIKSFNLTVDEANLDSVWEVVPVDNTVSNVFPTWSKNTTVILRLAEGATVANHGSFDLVVTESGGTSSATITVHASVAPAYAPSIEAVSGSNRVPMVAGGSVDLPFLAHNLGTVSDTLILDVEVEPDLSGWWANQTNSSTGNNGSSGNTTSPPTVSVLMYGNSYTSANTLHQLVDGQLDNNGFNGTTQANTGGGLRLPQHWSNLNTSGHQWNTSLRSSSWDYAVIQDQSQVPSFPVTESTWQESKNASVLLAEAIADEGADPVLFMTWGRRSGDSMNAFNDNFTNMQSNLLDGYTRYAQNITNAGVDVYMAPVGLAFKTVHDLVQANGTDPTLSGNLFYDLYTSDGSHPSLAGSYLASCVLFSSLTGQVCVESNATTTLASSVKLALEQAADDTVFNQTSGMSYYPWEGMQPAAFGLGGGVPAGWSLQWDDDELSGVPAQGNESVVLTVNVPTGASPDFYGYRLTIGSTGGNVTSSTLLVVEVLGEPELAMAFLDQDASFFPGTNVQTQVQVTNVGNQLLDIMWSVETGNTTACTASMVDASTTGLAANAVVNVSLNVVPGTTTSSVDRCPLTLQASVQNGTQTSVLSELQFIVQIDELVNFTLTTPSALPAFAPADGLNYDVTVFNHGSDPATFVLTVDNHELLNTVMMTASAIVVASDSFGIWTVRTTGEANAVGTYTQGFSTQHSGTVDTASVDLTLSAVASGSLTGPFDSRVVVQPNSEQQLLLNLSNTGTQNLSLTAGINGIPSGVVVSISNPSVVLTPSAYVGVTVTFNASASVVAGSHPANITYSANGLTLVYEFIVQIEDRRGVLLTTAQPRLYATPTNATTWSLDVTNTGTVEELLVLTLSTESSGQWFDATLSATTMTLAPGNSRALGVNIIESVVGAPVSGVNYTLTVSSTTDSMVMDHATLLVIPVTANANLTVLKEDVSALPGDVVFGSVIVTNTGTGTDTFTVSTIGQDCGLDMAVSLGPGLSSPALGWSCTVPNSAQAGSSPITFRAVSQVRSNVAVDFSILYTVEPSWPGNTLVAVGFDTGRLSLGVDSSTSTVVTVENFGNAEVTGSLEVYGEDTGLFLFEWLRLNDETESNDYTLSAGSTATYKLTIVSNTDRSAQAELVVRATSQGPGVTTSDASPVLAVDVEGPALPPNGLSLPLGLEVGQSSALGAIGAGWFLAVASLLLLRRRRTDTLVVSDSLDDVDEIDDSAEDEAELGFNETRLDEHNKVACPSCEARLGVPRGSEPPFRFTCPQCTSKIRVVP